MTKQQAIPFPDEYVAEQREFFIVGSLNNTMYQSANI